MIMGAPECRRPGAQRQLCAALWWLLFILVFFFALWRRREADPRSCVLAASLALLPCVLRQAALHTTISAAILFGCFWLLHAFRSWGEPSQHICGSLPLAVYRTLWPHARIRGDGASGADWPTWQLSAAACVLRTARTVGRFLFLLFPAVDRGLRGSGCVRNGTWASGRLLSRVWRWSERCVATHGAAKSVGVCSNRGF